MTIHAKSKPYNSGRCRGLGTVEGQVSGESIGVDTEAVQC
jgi:hypothetical protein